MADEVTKAQGGQPAAAAAGTQTGGGAQGTHGAQQGMQQGGQGEAGGQMPARRTGGRAPMAGQLAPWGGPGIRRIFDDVDRLFEDMGRSVFGRSLFPSPMLGRSLFEGPFGAMSGVEQAAPMWSPCIDMRDTGTEVVVAAELPGVNPEDVQIECTDDGLTIRGETHAEETTEQSGVYRSERRYGSFFRQIPLPPDIDLDKAQAQFQNGLLKIRLPRTEAAQQRVRRIPIQGQTAVGGGGQAESHAQGGGQKPTGGRGGRAA